MDLDDLLSTIFGGLDALGKRDTTYFWFSSDNGYHLGEHRLLYGKTEPYETDTRLPMYVTGLAYRAARCAFCRPTTST